VLADVNAHRAAAGLPRLRHDAEIAAIARGHSLAMARSSVPFGHVGFRSRVDAIIAIVPLASMAENVSKHTRKRSQVARAAVDGWLGSARHRKNLEGNHDVTGIGAAENDSGTVYLTQIFVETRAPATTANAH
jgi:uncharacterized protein YkwD